MLSLWRCPDLSGRREEVWVGHQVKAFEKLRFRPTYAGANVGHPSCLRASKLPEKCLLGSKVCRSNAVMNVNLGPGQATFLDLPGSTLVSKLGQRAVVQPRGYGVGDGAAECGGLSPGPLRWPDQPDPCFAQLGFQNSSGNPVGTTTAVTLQPGQSASLAINGNSLASQLEGGCRCFRS
jgi:hypothetical protein